MKTLLLSDQAILQIGLQGALADLEHRVDLFRTSQIITAYTRVTSTDQRPNLVMIDLGWCGLRSLKAVVQRIMGQISDVPLAILVNRPDEVSQVRLAGVDADMFLAKTAAPAVMRQALVRFMPVGVTVS
jgi:DNA-binding response OmpR family regulator